MILGQIFVKIQISKYPFLDPDPGEPDMATYGPFRQLGQVEMPQKTHSQRNLNYTGTKFEGVPPPLCDFWSSWWESGKIQPYCHRPTVETETNEWTIIVQHKVSL